MSMWGGHTRGGDTYVTVIIDLTPIRDGAALQDPKLFRARCRWLVEPPEDELQAILTAVFLPHRDEIVQRCGEVEGAATSADLSA